MIFKNFKIYLLILYKTHIQCEIHIFIGNSEFVILTVYIYLNEIIRKSNRHQ